ncbi:MAG: sigma-70 family RNA polymerase sigma factor [Bacteroidota bacterium]
MRLPWSYRRWDVQEIAKAISLRDKKAFDAAYQVYYQYQFSRLVAWATKGHKLSEKEAEDLVQDSLIRTMESAWFQEVRDLLKLEAFTRQVLRRRIADYFKGKPIVPIRDFEVPEGGEEGQKARFEERFEQALGFFNRLGEKCQRILLMRTRGYSMQEIAVELAYSSADVAKKTKERCMKKLAEMMGPSAT